MPKQAWDLDPARAASFPAVGPSCAAQGVEQHPWHLSTR